MEDMKEYSNRQILENILSRCNEEEIAIIKDIAVATFPNLENIKKIRREDLK